MHIEDAINVLGAALARLGPKGVDQASILASDWRFSGLSLAHGSVSGRVCTVNDLTDSPSILLSSSVNIDLALIGRYSGIVTTEGTFASHFAIRARTLGIPAVKVSRADFAKLVSYKNTLVQVVAGESVGYVQESQALEAGAGAIDSSSRIHVAQIAKANRKIRVLANVDTAEDARSAARDLADGVGMWRTENFIKLRKLEQVLSSLVKDIALSRPTIRSAVEYLQGLLANELREIVSAFPDGVVNVRLLDLSVGELLTPSDAEEITRELGKDYYGNDALGLRGARLAVSFEALTRLQIQAILMALRNGPPTVSIGILLSFVTLSSEVHWLRQVIDDEVSTYSPTTSFLPKIRLGITIETPRSILLTDQLSDTCDFFSFGTNDLTQYVWGVDRDHAHEVMTTTYLAKKLMTSDPFMTLDRAAVLEFMRMAMKGAGRRRKSVEFGVSGAHAAVDFELLADNLIDYISVPAAQTLQLSIKLAILGLSRVGIHPSPNDAVVGSDQSAVDDREVVYSGSLYQVIGWNEHRGDGSVHRFERAERPPGVRVMVTHVNAVLIVKERRGTNGLWDYRLPGGKVFDNLNDYEVARASSTWDLASRVILAGQRELFEETTVQVAATGLRLKWISRLGETVGWDLHYLECEAEALVDLPPRVTTHEGEELLPVWLDWDDVIELCDKGAVMEDRTAAVLYRAWRERIGGPYQR